MVDRFEHFSFAIFEISKYWHKLAGEEMEKYDLKGPHCIYLLALARTEEGLTAPQLCETCSKDKSDVSRMMRIMQEKGLVTKEGEHQNRYGGVFRLTDRGMYAAEQVQHKARQAVELAGKDLTDANRTIFYESLDSIVTNLRELSKNGIPNQ